MTWFSRGKGRLFLVADVSGVLVRAAFPVAWGLAVHTMTASALIAWLTVGVLYVVHSVTLSSAVRRDTASKVSATIVDGVTLNPQDAARIRKILDEARNKLIDTPPVQ